MTEKVVYVLVFLELTDDEWLDPRLALKQMESIAHGLQRLPATELTAFLELVDELAQRELRPDIAQFISDIPENLGLRGGGD